MPAFRPALLLLFLPALVAQTLDGKAAYTAFLKWKDAPENRSLPWEQAIAKYSGKLIAGGLDRAVAARTISIIEARDEGVFYDPVYAGAETGFPNRPNRLLIEAVADRKPGTALDIAMGQGRNALYLARLGWDVTGFDTSQAGLDRAQAAARAAGLKIRTVLASDEEFEFGIARWDLIALIYPIEKRSVHRIRQALKPGGVVVVECGHKEDSNAPFEYGVNELLEIFAGFRILKYEDAPGDHEWAHKRLRLVRLIATKP